MGTSPLTLTSSALTFHFPVTKRSGDYLYHSSHNNIKFDYMHILEPGSEFGKSCNLKKSNVTCESIFACMSSYTYICKTVAYMLAKS